MRQEIVLALELVRQTDQLTLEHLLKTFAAPSSPAAVISSHLFQDNHLSDVFRQLQEHFDNQSSHLPIQQTDILKTKSGVSGKKSKGSNSEVLGGLDDEDMAILEQSSDDVPFVTYSIHKDEFIHGLMYKTVSLDYLKMFYGDSKKIPPQFVQDSEYMVGNAVVSDTEREMLTTEEAQQTLVDIQYATSVGAHSSVNFRERHKFDLWIKFNHALFNMMESLYAVTSEIDYSRVG